jgi:hypothetical protein
MGWRSRLIDGNRRRRLPSITSVCTVECALSTPSLDSPPLPPLCGLLLSFCPPRQLRFTGCSSAFDASCFCNSLGQCSSVSQANMVGWVIERGVEAVGHGGRQWDVVGCGRMWWEEERWVTWQREVSTNKVCSACRNC